MCVLRAQATTKRDKAIKAKQTSEVDEQQEKLDLLNAAEVWQRGRLLKANFSEIQLNHKVIMKAKSLESLPFLNRLILTKRVTMEHLRASDTSWIASVWPWDDSVPPSPWECSAPTLKALVGELERKESEYDDGDMLNGETFAQNWQQCFLNDEVLSWMDDETKHHQLLKQITLFLQLVITKETMTDDGIYDIKPPACLDQAFSEVVRVFRGLAALMCPKPGHLRSTKDDVDFLRDIGTNGTLGTTGVKIKKSLLKRLTRKPFQTFVTDFITYKWKSKK